jgi:sulfide:quinone oxidoreductase
VHLFTPEAGPMAVAGAEVGAAVTDLLIERGIEIHTETTVSAISSEELSLADGQSHPVSLILGVPPHRPPAVLADSGLAAGSYLPVDPAALTTGHAGISAIGDVTSIPLAGGKVLPKAGVFAERQAQVVARRIATDLCGRTPTEQFDGKGSCFIELGDGRAGYAGGGFYGADGPAIGLHRPGRRWHLAKIAYEQWWLRRWL